MKTKKIALRFIRRAILVISFALQTVIFFADGKKLYFDFVKVIFRLSAEVKVFYP